MSMFEARQFGGFSGLGWIPSGTTDRHPLVIAIHGGTYTSRYFDVPDHSLLERAERNGIPIIAIDRYGYGDTPFIDDMSILGQASKLGGALADLWDRHCGNAAGVVLVGHSIGAAIALSIASDPGRLPLLGIAVSGVGVRTPEMHGDMWNSLPDTLTVDMPELVKDQVMFGPEGSFAAVMPSASYIANASVPRAELIDIVGAWQLEAAAICARIRVPVHYRQAEHDRLWIVDDAEIQSFASRLTSSARVDAAMVGNTGHCMDFHTIGHALQLQQLAFAMKCAVEAPHSS